jgi:hypothetical protein
LKQWAIPIILLAITAGVLIGYNLCAHAPETAEITPAVTGSGLELTVTNGDAFDWTNVQLELNTVFRYETAAIHAGESLHIQLQDFAKLDGIKFDPLTEKPGQLRIVCDTPDGKAEWLGGMAPGT